MTAGPYGSGFYGSDGYKGGVQDELHYKALRKLLPLPTSTDPSQALDKDLHIEGASLDTCYFMAQDLNKELFQDSFEFLAQAWKRCWGLQASVWDIENLRAEAQARARVMANKDKRLNPAFFISLAQSLGFTAAITENGSDCFIIGSGLNASKLSHTLYSRTRLWEWTMTATGPTDPEVRLRLESIINSRKPAFTLVHFIYS